MDKATIQVITGTTTTSMIMMRSTTTRSNRSASKPRWILQVCLQLSLLMWLCFSGATNTATAFSVPALANDLGTGSGTEAGEGMDAVTEPLLDVAATLAFTSRCANTTLEIREKVQELLLLTPASVSSSTELDSLELALSSSARAERKLAALQVLHGNATTVHSAVSSAIEDYKTAIDEVPGVVSAYCRLTELLLASQQIVAALEILDELLLRWPDDPVGLRMAANVLAGRGQHAIGVAKGERLVELGVASRDDLLMLGRGYWSMAKKQQIQHEQLHDLSAAPVREGQMVFAHKSPGNPGSKIRDESESSLLSRAERYFRLALMTPSDQENLGPVDAKRFVFRGRASDGPKTDPANFSGVSHSAANISAYMDFAAVLAAREDWDSAFAVVDEFLLRFPQAARVHFAKGLVCLEKARSLAAVLHQASGPAASITTLLPASAVSNERKTVMFLESQAVSHFQQATWLDARMWDAHWQLGRLLATKPHRVDEAMVHLQQVVQLRPDFSDGFLTMQELSLASAKILASRGNIAEALRMYRRGSIASTADKSTTAEFVRILLAEKGVPSKLAVHQYEQMLQELPEEPSIHILLARTLSEMGALARSEARFRVALRLAPDSFEAHYGMAQCLERQGRSRFAEALAHYAQAVKQNASHPQLRLNIIRLKIVQYDESPEPLLSFFEQHDTVGKGIRETRFISSKIAVNEEILDHLRAAIKLQPRDAHLHFLVGQTVVNGSTLRNQQQLLSQRTSDPQFLLHTREQAEQIWAGQQNLSAGGTTDRLGSSKVGGLRECAHYDGCRSLLRHIGPEVALAAARGRRYFHKAVGLNKSNAEYMFALALALEGEALEVVRNATPRLDENHSDAAHVPLVVLSNDSYSTLRRFQRQAIFTYETAFALSRAQDSALFGAPSAQNGEAKASKTSSGSSKKLWHEGSRQHSDQADENTMSTVSSSMLFRLRELAVRWRLCRLYMGINNIEKAAACFFDATELAQAFVGLTTPRPDQGDRSSTKSNPYEGKVNAGAHTSSRFLSSNFGTTRREKERKYQESRALPPSVFGRQGRTVHEDNTKHSKGPLNQAAKRLRGLESRINPLVACGGQRRCQWALLWSELAASHFILGDPLSARHVLAAALIEWPLCAVLHRDMAAVMLALGSDSDSERALVFQHINWTSQENKLMAQWQSLQRLKDGDQRGISLYDQQPAAEVRFRDTGFDLFEPWPSPQPTNVQPSVELFASAVPDEGAFLTDPVQAHRMESMQSAMHVLRHIAGAQIIGSPSLSTIPTRIVDLLVAAEGNADLALLSVVFASRHTVLRYPGEIDRETEPRGHESVTQHDQDSSAHNYVDLNTSNHSGQNFVDGYLRDNNAPWDLLNATVHAERFAKLSAAVESPGSPNSTVSDTMHNILKDWHEYLRSDSAYNSICIWLDEAQCTSNAAGGWYTDRNTVPRFWLNSIREDERNETFNSLQCDRHFGPLNEAFLRLGELLRLQGHWRAAANCFTRVEGDDLRTSYAQLRLANIRDRHFRSTHFTEPSKPRTGALRHSSPVEDPFHPEHWYRKVKTLYMSSSVFSPVIAHVLPPLSEIQDIENTRAGPHAANVTPRDQSVALAQFYGLALLHLRQASRTHKYSVNAKSSLEGGVCCASSNPRNRNSKRGPCDVVCLPAVRQVPFFQLPLLLEAADFFERHAVHNLLVREHSAGSAAVAVSTCQVADLLQNESVVSLADFAGADLTAAMKNAAAAVEGPCSGSDGGAHGPTVGLHSEEVSQDGGCDHMPNEPGPCTTSVFWDAATDLYLDAAQSYPDSVQAQLEAVEALMRRGQWGTAMTTLRRLVEELPDPERDPHRQYNAMKFQPLEQHQYLPQHLLAICMFQATAELLEAQRAVRETGDASSGAAQRHWAKQLKIVARNTTTQFQAALSLADGRRDVRALSAVYNDLGQFHELLAQPQQAADSYVRAIDSAALTPHLWTPALGHLGRLLLHDKQPAMATEFLQRVVFRSPPIRKSQRGSPEFVADLSGQGEAFPTKGVGDTGGMAAEYFDVLEFFEQPEFRWVNPLVARRYLTSLRAGSQAALGKALLSEGRTARAAQVLDAAVLEHPYHVEILELATTAARALGRAAQARKHLRLAIQLREQRQQAFEAERRRSAAAVADVNRVAWMSSEVDGEDTYLAHYRKQQVEEQRRWRGSASTQHAVVHHLPTSVPTLARDDEHGCRATLFQGAHFDGWEANFDGEGSFFASVWADHGARVGEVSSLRVEGGNRTSQCFVELFEGERCNGLWVAAFGPGSYPLPDLASAGVVNDRARSLRISRQDPTALFSQHMKDSNESLGRVASSDVPVPKLSTRLRHNEELCAGLHLGASGRACKVYVAYREKTAELQKLEQDVIREAVVSSEIDVFLEEASTLDRSGRTTEAIHRANIAAELAAARMPTRAGSALLQLCHFQSRAGLPDMAASTCRRALHARPASCTAQVKLAQLEAQAGRFAGAVKLLDDLLYGGAGDESMSTRPEKEWGDMERDVEVARAKAVHLLPMYLERTGDLKAAVKHYSIWLRKEPQNNEALLALGSLLAVTATASRMTDVQAGSASPMKVWTGVDHALTAVRLFTHLGYRMICRVGNGDNGGECAAQAEVLEALGVEGSTSFLAWLSADSSVVNKSAVQLDLQHFERFLRLVKTALPSAPESEQKQTLPVCDLSVLSGAATVLGSLSVVLGSMADYWPRLSECPFRGGELFDQIGAEQQCWMSGALEMFEVASTLDPSNLLARAAIGDLRFAEGDLEGGIAAYRRMFMSAELNQQSIPLSLWVAFGTAVSAIGEGNDTCWAFEQALTKVPSPEIGSDSMAVVSGLAQHQALSSTGPGHIARRVVGGGTASAGSLLSASLMYNPASVHTLYGRALARLGNWTGAERQFETAVALATPGALRAEHVLPYEALHDFGLVKLRLGKLSDGADLLRHGALLHTSNRTIHDTLPQIPIVLQEATGPHSAAIHLAEALAAAENTLVVAATGSSTWDHSTETRRVLGLVLEEVHVSLNKAKGEPPSGGGCALSKQGLDLGRDLVAASRLLARDYIRRPRGNDDLDAAAEVLISAWTDVSEVLRRFVLEEEHIGTLHDTLSRKHKTFECDPRSTTMLKQREDHLKHQLAVLVKDAAMLLQQRSGLLSSDSHQSLAKLTAQ